MWSKILGWISRFDFDHVKTLNVELNLVRILNYFIHKVALKRFEKFKLHLFTILSSHFLSLSASSIRLNSIALLSQAFVIPLFRFRIFILFCPSKLFSMSYEPGSFDEDVFLLSSTCHIRDHIPKPTRSEESPALKNHVSLLDDIALLFVTKAVGDVCAITWRVTKGQMEIFYSKNAPTCKSLDPYLREVQQILMSPLHPYEKEKQLLLLVIRTCLEKFRARM